MIIKFLETEVGDWLPNVGYGRDDLLCTMGGGQELETRSGEMEFAVSWN
jgi:hypothetical protein